MRHIRIGENEIDKIKMGNERQNRKEYIKKRDEKCASDTLTDNVAIHLINSN